MSSRRGVCWGIPLSLNCWEGVLPKEREEECRARHVVARRLCLTCPLLDVCEGYLSGLEKQGLRVDGVVAGRYCDVSGSFGVQDRCAGCGDLMRPQGFELLCPWARQRFVGVSAVHVGQGLCSVCFPLFARGGEGC